MNQAWNEQAELLFKTKKAIKYYESMAQLYLEQLKVLSDGKPASGDIYELKTVVRPGSVEYSKVPELFGVGLDQYRKEPVTSWLLVEKVTKPEGL
jgi:hypothetical protein